MDPRLQKIFADLTDVHEEGAHCPPLERILDSADGKLSAEDDSEVIRHIGECGGCSTAWWLARETSENPSLKHGPDASHTLTRVLRSWPSMAAAALVIIAIGLVGYQFLQDRQPAGPVYRVQAEDWLGSELEAGRPLPRTDCILRWTAGPDGTVYDVIVTNEDLEILARVLRHPEPSYRILPGALDRLQPGTKLLWRVTAYLPDGSETVSPTFTSIVE
jgi:hypothetical protein